MLSCIMHLTPNHVMLEIDIAVNGDALLPIPIDENTLTVGGALDTYVAWLINIVVLDPKYQSWNSRLSEGFSPG
ncbi:hypothetical protein Lal_00043191 [Lupinus albus]|nr:hypothetical protein Lal_00043191 [Lupinus albus]